MNTTSIAAPSVMSLFLEVRHLGQTLGNGTGFLVDGKSSPLLITNWHNLSGRRPDDHQPIHPSAALPDEVVIGHNGPQLGNWILKTERLLDASGRPLWREHPTHKEKVDLVALPLTDTSEIARYPYQLQGGPALALGPTDIVSVIGFPFRLSGGGLFAIWATGFVASEPNVDLDSLPLFLIDCRGRPGQSGSPVVAYRGGGSAAMAGGGTAIFGGPVFKLFGIYSGRVNEQSDLGRVWKVSAIQELVDSIL